MAVSHWATFAFAQQNGSAKEMDFASLFESANPEVQKFAAEIFEKCVIAKIREPEGLLKHRWLQAGTGDKFYGQWIWDTMFIADLMALLPDKKELLRGVFQNYWDFQQQWNLTQPEYAHDMVCCVINPGGIRKFTQFPILGWGLERIYTRNGDKELLRQCLKPLENYHEWYWRERDLHNIGLLVVGSYSGVLYQARFESFDKDCSLDNFELTAHPTRTGPKEGKWYGNVCVPGNTALLVNSEQCLARLATEMGDHEMAARRQKRIDKSVAAMREHMWDEDKGVFVSVYRDSLEKISVGTIGGFMGLLANVPTDAMKARMAEVILTDHWQTPLPVPTVDAKDPRYDPGAYWRGNVWPVTNYQVASAFAKHGYAKIAAQIADRSVAAALKNGIYEFYNSQTAKGGGVPNLGMSCTFLTMMLDGLTEEYSVKLAPHAKQRA